MEYMESHSTISTFIRTHFYTKRLPHLEPEQQAQYDAIRANLFNEIEPSNAIEHEVFEQLVHASWQLDRTRALEDFALTQLSVDPNNSQFRKNYTSFQKSRQALDRTINSALKELRRLITTRILAVAVDCNTMLTTQTEANVPALLDLQKILPANERQPNAQHLTMSLARLKNPNATYTPPELAAKRLKARAA